MAFEVDPDLNQALMPLAWMIGRWQGNGHGSWPGMGDFEFGQQIDFATNRGPYLHYLSQTWTLDADGQPDEPLTMEGGIWRPAGIGEVEVVLANPEGWAEVWAKVWARVGAGPAITNAPAIRAAKAAVERGGRPNGIIALVLGRKRKEDGQ